MKKKVLSIILFFVSLVLIMTSCNQDLDYKKACEEKNFIKAYKIVDYLKGQTSEKKIQWYEAKKADRLFPGQSESDYTEYCESKEKSDEAERYVILQETLYVLESQGSEGLVRIVGIGKEHNAEDWLYSELLDVANKIGDSELAVRIQNIINAESNKIKE